MVAMSPIHILAFGNSITAGWVKMELPFHPYSGSLISTLQQHLPSAQITVDVQGMPGDQVVSPTDGSCTNCGVFVPRITTLCKCVAIGQDFLSGSAKVAICI
jgi:hypothetical protein